MKRKFFEAQMRSGVFSLQAKKSLGQNFLVDSSIVEAIADVVERLCINQDVSKSEGCIQEIGPGAGALTSAILQRGWYVLAVEKDARAVEGLKETLGEQYPESFHLIQSDILKWDLLSFIERSSRKKHVCIGNIPYYITSEILLWFCRNSLSYAGGLFMVQDEVAERLTASCGTKEYGRLSIIMQLFFQVEKVLFVPAECFRPIPKVNSAIITLIPKKFSFDSAQEEKSFGAFTAMLFSARRKMLRKILGGKLQKLEETHPGVSNTFWEYAGSWEVKKRVQAG